MTRSGFAPSRMLLVVALVAASLAGACAARPPVGFVESYTEPYRLDSGDQLRVTVYGEADLTNVYAVDQAGYVTVPLIGSVAARGSTTTELASSIAAALRQGFLRTPDVAVEVAEYRPFFIQGEVRNPGQYPYISGLTIETAVAVAGGFTPRANEVRATVTRIVNGEQISGTIPVTEGIRPGDSIIVGQRLF